MQYSEYKPENFYIDDHGQEQQSTAPSILTEEVNTFQHHVEGYCSAGEGLISALEELLRNHPQDADVLLQSQGLDQRLLLLVEEVMAVNRSLLGILSEGGE